MALRSACNVATAWPVQSPPARNQRSRHITGLWAVPLNPGIVGSNSKVPEKGPQIEAAATAAASSRTSPTVTTSATKQAGTRPAATAAARTGTALTTLTAPVRHELSTIGRYDASS
jgi:hypothetical protein